MEAIILDTETTGLETNEVIELAFAEVVFIDNSGNIDTTQEALFNFKPKSEMQYGAMAVHHILPEELEDFPPSSEAAGKVPKVEYIIGHNIDYDIKALGIDLDSVKRIDTLAIARKLWPECDSHTQSALMYYLNEDKVAVRNVLKRAHNALADIRICKTILDHALADLYLLGVWDMESLYQYSEAARIPEKMAFGKHKGERIEDVPYDWIKWYASQANTDPYLIKAFKMAGKLR